METEKIQYLLITTGKTLSQTGCTRKEREVFHQRMMGRHQTQRQTSHVLAVLAGMVVVEALWSGHCLPSNGYRSTAGKSPSCIYEGDCRNHSIGRNITADCETDSSFNELLYFATRCRNCRCCRRKCLVLLACAFFPFTLTCANQV